MGGGGGKRREGECGSTDLQRDAGEGRGGVGVVVADGFTKEAKDLRSDYMPFEPPTFTARKELLCSGRKLNLLVQPENLHPLRPIRFKGDPIMLFLIICHVRMMMLQCSCQMWPKF